jgi:oligopeptide/dipeptide ABC transporter ATP-binding protein
VSHDLLELRGVSKAFRVNQGILNRRSLTAVDSVNLRVPSGRTVGLVGESGSGKTTLGRLALGLIKPTSGEVLFEGRPLHRLSVQERRRVRLRVQPIFQDPYSSLNPRKTVYQIVRAPLDVHGIGRAAERAAAVARELAGVGLGIEYLRRLPHQLSGGERQRVSIARALILRPALVIADEPTSSVDVSVQAQLLKVLQSIQDNLGITYLFISHNLAVIRQISDFVAVMYLGRVVEFGTRDQIFERPKHPYTQALLNAVLSPDPARRRRHRTLPGELVGPLQMPSGCRFRTRCPHQFGRCMEEDPPDNSVEPGHWAACHLYGDATASGVEPAFFAATN